MTDISTIDRLGCEKSTPSPDVFQQSVTKEMTRRAIAKEDICQESPTLKEILKEIWESRTNQLMSDFSRVCRERAKEILTDAMDRIDWSSVAVAVVVDGLDPETMEERLREWFAQVLAEEIVG